MMKSERLKGAIFGVVLTLLLVSTVGVFASGQINKNIKVLYSNIKLVVDGKTIEFGNDSAGNKIEPFIYNGTTYLPVRSVGEALGKRVDWDGKTNTVFIGKTDMSESDVFLNDMDYFSSGQEYEWGHYEWKNYNNNSISPITDIVEDNTGKVYDTGLNIYLKGSGTGATKGLSVYHEYLLNQQYSKFKGSFILNYGDRSKEYVNAKLLVYGDDKLIYESKPLKKGVMPIDFDIDVSNVIKLKVEIINDSSINDMSYKDSISMSIVNPGLYK